MLDPAAARRAGARARPVRPRRHRQGCARLPPTWRRPRSRRSPMPRRSGASPRSPKPTCSTANIGRWNWPSSAQRARPAARRPGRRHHRRRRRHRRCDRRSLRHSRRGSGAARYRCCALRKRRRTAIGGSAIALACDVTDAALRARRLRRGDGDLRRRRYRCVQRRRRLAGQDRRGRRSHFAAKLRAEFLRPPASRAGRRAASCWRRAPAAACCSTCRSRR